MACLSIEFKTVRYGALHPANRAGPWYTGAVATFDSVALRKLHRTFMRWRSGTYAIILVSADGSYLQAGSSTSSKPFSSIA